MDPIKIIEHAGLTVEIHHDDTPESPREWCDLSRIAAWHRRSNLGDKGLNLSMDEFKSPDDARQHLVAEHGAKHLIPVYLYEHGQQVIKASKDGNPFNCPWDSGQVGWVFTTDEKISEVGTPEDLIEEGLIREVESYAEYLIGAVYGYIVKGPAGEDLSELLGDKLLDDSCWGLYGVEYAESEATQAAEYCAARIAAERAEAAEWAARDTVTV